MTELINRDTNVILADKLKIYKDTFHKTRGLMFSLPLKKGEAIVLVANEESKLETTIHMFFVFFSIDVVWLNKEKEVVDKKEKVVAFTPLIVPKQPAKYVIELRKGCSKHVKIGDKLDFVE
jgi:uncharacterized protein